MRWFRRNFLSDSHIKTPVIRTQVNRKVILIEAFDGSLQYFLVM